jgi:hypothetical protein
MFLCYFGSLGVVDGVKTSWMEQWRHMHARGWRIKYATPTENPLPLLRKALDDVGAEVVQASLPVLPGTLTMDDAENFVPLMLSALQQHGCVSAGCRCNTRGPLDVRTCPTCDSRSHRAGVGTVCCPCWRELR